MKRILSSTLFALILLSTSLSAQEVKTITLQQAIDIALENNYLLKQAKNNLTLANESIRNEYADFLPSIDASLNGSRQVGQQNQLLPGGDIRSVELTSKGISGNFGASVTLFNGFENIKSLRISQEIKTSEEENLKRAKENIIFTTASRYLQVLLDKQLLEIAEENLKTSMRQLEQVQAQVEVGSRPTVDLYNQEAQVANDELSVTQNESNYELSKLFLIRQLQIEPLGNYEFVIPEINESNIGAERYNVSQLVDQALLNRSDLKSEVANLNRLKYQLEIANGSLYPTLSASGGYSTNYSDQYFGGGISFNDQFFDTRIQNSIRISLNIPIFQNWNRMYNIESSKIQLKNAELGYENTKLQVIQEVVQAHNDYTSYTKQLEAAQKSMRASERAFETQQERYNVGSSTLIELSQAQANYVEAQSNYTQAMYNLIFQEKLLDYYLGKLNGNSVKL